MNRRMILYTICIVLRVEAVLMVPALIIALVNGEANMVFGFLCSIAVLLAVSLLSVIIRPKEKIFYAREGFLIVALGWLLVAVFGALPYFFSGVIPNFVDCLFESMSGFSTTAATIIPDVEIMPISMLYWRSFTLWLGGMGVLVFLLAIIPLSKNSGSTMHLLRAESPGPQPDKLMPRMHNYAKMLYIMYLVLTLAQFLILLSGGLPVFDSLTTAFGTAGTGGFGIYNDSMASFPEYAQIVTNVFMVLFGINFNVYYFLLIREFGKALKNEELRLYIGIMVTSIILITINVLPLFQYMVREATQHVSFQVASIMTTTGFTTVDFNTWPQFSRTMLVVLMVIGACAGSTGGGIKVARVLLLGKSFVRDIRKMVNPRSVSVVRMNNRVVEEDVIRAARSFLTAYVLIVLVSVVLVSLNSLSVETTVTAVIACTNNIGIGLDLVGPYGNYTIFSSLSKLVLSADMLIGRLEIFPVLMLLMPSAWKR